MRVLALSALALAATACDSGDVPTPSEAAQLRPSAPQVEADEVLLRGDGLVAGNEAFYLAAGQREVEGAIARALGKASEGGTNDACGAGPVAYSTFPGGLTVNFQDGSLVGWLWRDASENIELAGEIAIGAPRSEIEAEDGFAMIEGSTLGEEFSLGERVGGFFEDGELSMLYAGTQCFFR
ncbi:aspartate-semialdehyde dehydrogenase [Erythrobacter rubeus]|uniref:Aspartate-semialdehyde dehydrogenase n=1 Tax=Erythrobacter rubeus TaxID=2760803 RepID=A0ABR8KM38_9SPHN|nr:aspartate-semialdehyde dehydrogenase [Erythrobacter rubeus]MBD2841568.1 aspartate-semialdehyde dehydrogenase [Erythrobacter rubeus]